MKILTIRLRNINSLKGDWEIDLTDRRYDESGIFAITTLVPALGFFLLALVLGIWYPLHKKQVDENIAKLKQKHAEQN